MSAGLPPIADIARLGRHGRKVPTTIIGTGYSITSSAQYSSFAEREVMECRPKLPPSLRLDAREPDNLAPLLGLVSDEFAEVGGRARNHRRA